MLGLAVPRPIPTFSKGLSSEPLCVWSLQKSILLENAVEAGGILCSHIHHCF